MAGQTGFGFSRHKDGTIVTVPGEVAVIRGAVLRSLDGQSLRSICIDLNNQGITGPGRCKRAGRPWNSTTLKQLVLRESLAGQRRHRGVVVGELHESLPHILTLDEHDRLKALLNDPVRRTAPAGRTPKYLLGGMVKSRVVVYRGVLRCEG